MRLIWEKIDNRICGSSNKKGVYYDIEISIQ